MLLLEIRIVETLILLKSVDLSLLKSVDLSWLKAVCLCLMKYKRAEGNGHCLAKDRDIVTLTLWIHNLSYIIFLNVCM